MTAKRTRLTHKIAIINAPSGREQYHLQFSLQAASPETFGYGVVLSNNRVAMNWDRRGRCRCVFRKYIPRICKEGSRNIIYYSYFHHESRT